MEKTDIGQAGSESEYHEAIVIGMGMNGLYQLHSLLEAKMDAIALDRNADVGGTWFNNRYPGCRFDSESYTYGFYFSKDLQLGWDWSERFTSQDENLRYTRYVADTLKLRDHIHFNTWVESAEYDEADGTWRLRAVTGKKYSCQFLILCPGLLSCKTLPAINGIEDFEGPSFHTMDWPHEPVELKGRRVAVVGTGATGVQVIQTIAEEVDELLVFQRRPNWCAPLNNAPISGQEMEDIKRHFDEIFELCLETPGGFVHMPDRRRLFDVPREERLAMWDRLYEGPGFGIWLQNFVDIFVDEKANAEISAYIADRIRDRVNDPQVAEKLIPKDHGFGVQRVPLETNYYETYNRDNVRLISLQDEPVQRVTATGIQTEKQHYDVDIIVYATGFDAGIGPYTSFEIKGIGGQKLADKWRDGPQTYLGIMTNGFPNLLMPVGPQSGGGSVNFPVVIQMCVGWAMRLLNYMVENEKKSFNPEPEAEQWWCNKARNATDKLLARKATRHYITGVNTNIAGRDKPLKQALGYPGGNPKYRSILNDCADSDFKGIEFESGNALSEVPAQRVSA